MSFGLNVAQQEAVYYLEGPCLILAGAGSGKTRVIAQKIAYLIEQRGFEPKYIAALTFTNKAAAEMKDRLSTLLSDKVMSAPGKQGQRIPLKHLTVCTFHALGVKILRQEAHILGLKANFSIMGMDDCLNVLQTLLSTVEKGGLRTIQQTISLWKNQLIMPAQAMKFAKNEVEQEAAHVYPLYQATLKAYQAVDFDDLIVLPMQLFQAHEAVLDRWQNQLRYIFIDEYQDTNACQYALLKLLAGKRAAFTAVGDDDQAIYGWRGATLENLSLLVKDYPRLKVIKLEQNYRSTLRILSAANQVIAHNPKLFEKKLWSEHGLGDEISLLACQNEEHEAESVAFRLSAHKFDHRASFRDYAVLYRSNFQARIIEQVLRRERIPYVLSGGQSFFEKSEIRDICAYLRLLANVDDDPAFIRAITTPARGVGRVTLEALGRFAAQSKCALFEAALMGNVQMCLSEKQLEPLCVFCHFIQRLSEQAQRYPASTVLDHLIETIQYEAYLYYAFEERKASAKWQNVLDFLNWLKRKGTQPEEGQSSEYGFDQADGLSPEKKSLLELVQTVTLMSMLEGRDEEDMDAVRLSTIHAAKGLEYPHVFLIGVEEGVLPYGNTDSSLTDEQRVEEERRLMYVAITRAKRSLHVNWCKKRRRAGETVSTELSRFVAEMGLQSQSLKQPKQATMTPKDRLQNLKELLNKTS